MNIRLPSIALAAVVATLPAMRGLAQQSSETFSLKASLDTLIDWSNPLDVTPEKIERVVQEEGFKTSPYFAWSEDKSKARLGRRPYSNITVDLSALGGRVAIEEAMVRFQNGRARSIELETAAGTTAESLSKAVRELLKDEPAIRSVDMDAGGRVSFATWRRPDFLVIQASQAGGSRLPGAASERMARLPDGRLVRLEGGDTGPSLAIVRPDDARRHYIHRSGSGFAMLCDLDFLLEYPAAWQLSAETLDRQFDVADLGFQEQPFYQWLNTAKDRLRFSRSPFSNIRIDLRIFGGKVAVDEAIVDFKNGRPSLVSLSVYNRGDSGGMGPAEFEALYKACGQSLGQILNTRPRQQQPGVNQAVKTVGWMWQSPVCIALMEFNEFHGKGSRAAMPEFLRLKLAPPQNKDWNFGASPTGLLTQTLGKSALIRNVAKGANGDVHITGVPMVDQGDKGYCVAASCQRLFEYYHIAADQHEMAQLFGTDADRGTSSVAMEAALDRIDNRFRTRFKPLVSPSLARERNFRPPTNEKLFSAIKDSIDQGIPLLWALRIGLVPEDPPLPSAGQTSGGHMRMIIGYNESKNQLLFTDSWGAGHELKRMDVAAGFGVTDGLYVLQPRG